MSTTTEQNKARDREIVEKVFNLRNFDRLEEYFAPSITAHMRRDIGVGLVTAFPDLHYTIENQVAEGDMTVVRCTITGTNTGPFQGRPATGKPASWSAMVM